ncbi:MAG: aminotransferase class V-fold PLP-dependent enzyme [Spirochaetia bacterium]|nr:aminotransferase class V-fold PLP-dependent enzyme [Spirochaetia bacterium]
MTFNKSEDIFPVKKEFIYLSNCGVAPLYSGAAKAAAKFQEIRVNKGAAVFREYENMDNEFKKEAADFVNTPPLNISFMKNTAEAMSILANGYPFEKDDEIISYIHEYPSNHYPWFIQQNRGVKLKLLKNIHPPDKIYENKPYAFSFEELENMTTNKTRIIAISHVQFTSGYKADIEKLGTFCKERNIDLIIDTAQSLGSVALYPEKWNVSAFASSGWKWLLGPIGCGVLYTSPEFRDKIKITMAGADVVTQGSDYLNHTWQPFSDSRKFEYSSVEAANMIALTACFRDLFNKYKSENIQSEIFRLQNIFLEFIDKGKYKPVIFKNENRSGILSLIVNEPEKIVKQAFSKGLFLGTRGGYLRIAPHLYNDEEEMKQSAKILNELV